MVAREQPRSKVSAAYETIRAGIEAGRLKPGQDLPEAFLIDYVGLSRTPIRHALERLSGEGLVVTPPRSTPTVSRVSLDGVRDLFAYRRLLEPYAASLVAQQVAGDGAAADEFAAFRDRFDRMPASGDDETTAVVLALTDAFDRAIADRVGNGYLARQLNELRPHTKRLRNIAHKVPWRNEERLSDHVQMAAAIANGDEKEAADAMRRHLTNVERSIFDSLLHSSSASIDVVTSQALGEGPAFP